MNNMMAGELGKSLRRFQWTDYDMEVTQRDDGFIPTAFESVRRLSEINRRRDGVGLLPDPIPYPTTESENPSGFGSNISTDSSN
jgi:hypothetical protein